MIWIIGSVLIIVITVICFLYERQKKQHIKIIEKFNEECQKLYKQNREYYLANYDARKLVSGRNEMCGVARLISNERSIPCFDVKMLRETIMKLPVW